MDHIKTNNCLLSNLKLPPKKKKKKTNNKLIIDKLYQFWDVIAINYFKFSFQELGLEMTFSRSCTSIFNIFFIEFLFKYMIVFIPIRYFAN